MATEIHILHYNVMLPEKDQWGCPTSEEVAFIGSTRQAALDYMRTEENPVDQGIPWYWSVTTYVADDPRCKPRDMNFYDNFRAERWSRHDALEEWRDGVPEPAAKGP